MPPWKSIKSRREASNEPSHYKIETVKLAGWLAENYRTISWKVDAPDEPDLCEIVGEPATDEDMWKRAISAGAMPEDLSLDVFKRHRQEFCGKLFQAPPRKPTLERVEALEAKVAELEKRVDEGYREIESLKAHLRIQPNGLGHNIGEPIGL